MNRVNRSNATTETKQMKNFCKFVANVLNSRWFWGILFAAVGCIQIAVMITRDTRNEQDLNFELKFLDRVCKKTGTALDVDRGAYFKRTIYTCPDGQTHIR